LRALAFRMLLVLCMKYRPGWITRLQLQVLLDTTARAFAMPGKKIRSRTARGALREYAAFTGKCMKYGKADPKKLREEAYRTGNLIRRITGFRESRDIERLVFYLYSNLQISMSGHIPGEIVVSRCYFGRFYSPEQCALMSFVDEGIIAGISGGGRLEFAERITEGCGRCRACFSEAEDD